MLVSTRGRYALCIMLDLAQCPGDAPVPLRDVAERQGIPVKYAEAIMSTLCRGNLVSGERGKGGGYRLTRKPKEYPVGEILRLAEGSLSPVSCLEPEHDDCPRAGECLTLPLWVQLNRVIGDYLDGVTLRDLLRGKIPGAKK